MSLRSILTITAICLAGTLQAQDQKPKALALVKEAVAFAKKNGKEALLKETNQGQGRFHVKSGDDLYIFIYDMTGVCQAIGFQSQMVGVNRWGVKDQRSVSAFLLNRSSDRGCEPLGREGPGREALPPGDDQPRQDQGERLGGLQVPQSQEREDRSQDLLCGVPGRLDGGLRHLQVAQPNP